MSSFWLSFIIILIYKATFIKKSLTVYQDMQGLTYFKVKRWWNKIQIFAIKSGMSWVLTRLWLLLCSYGNISDSKGTQHSFTRPSAWKSFVFLESGWLDWTAGGSAHKHTRWSWKEKHAGPKWSCQTACYNLQKRRIELFENARRLL